MVFPTDPRRGDFILSLRADFRVGTSFSWGYKKASVLGSSWLDASAVQRILRISCKTDAVACMWSPL